MNALLIALGVLVLGVVIWLYRREGYTILSSNRTASRELWEEHTRLMRRFIIGYYDPTREFPDVVKAMAKNRAELISVYKSMAPNSAQPMKEYLDGLYVTIDTVLKNSEEKLDVKAPLYELYEKTGALSYSLASSLGISSLISEQLLRQYTKMTLNEVSLHILNDHKKERQIYLKLLEQSKGMSDYFSSRA